MTRRNAALSDDSRCPTERTPSRRAVVRSSGAVVVGLLVGATAGRAQQRGQYRPSRNGRMPEHMRRQAEEARAFSERLRNAESMEERMKIFAQRDALRRKQAVEELKDLLGISDAEWPVVKPRVEAVYDLVRPPQSFGLGSGRPQTEVDRAEAELREILHDDQAAVDEVKGRLGALRAAKEKARRELAAAQQSLRQLMTVRQEAQLVLRGLLD